MTFEEWFRDNKSFIDGFIWEAIENAGQAVQANQLKSLLEKTWNAGHSEGNEDGYRKGYDQGFTIGDRTGYAEGRRE